MSERIVAVKPRPRDRVRIELAGGRFFLIPEEQASGLMPGAELESETIERFDRMDQYFRGREKAMRLVAARARTIFEMRGALDKMELLESVREGIIGELKELELLDDRRFAEEFVRMKIDVRGMGPHRLRRDLRTKGVASAIIDQVVGAATTTDTQESLARQQAEKKVGGAVVDEKVARRVMAHLQRQGFDYDVINKVTIELLRRSGRDDIIED